MFTVVFCGSIVIHGWTFRNAAFTTGIGVVYEDEPLTYTNEKLPKLGLEPMRGVKLLAGHRLTPAT